MKILILTKSFEREVSALINYIRTTAPHIDIRVVVPSTSPIVLPVPVSSRRLYFSHHIRAACFSPALRRDFAQFQPDIIQVFEEFSGLLALQAVLLRHIYCPQAHVMVYSAENLPGNVRSVFRAAARVVRRNSALAFVCSHSVKRVLKAEGFPGPIEVFPLGVDPVLFKKCDPLPLKQELALDGKFVVGYVGRLLAIKGIFDLLEAMRELPDNVHLLCIGAGPEEARFRVVCEGYQIAHRVHLPGDIPYAELPGYINCMDVGIVPSRTTPRWQEQFGRVVVELMSCEVPVIGSDSGSIPELLGHAGQVFPEGCISALIACIQDIMAHPEKRCEMGQQGCARVHKFYSLDVMYRKFFTMYERLNS